MKIFFKLLIFISILSCSKNNCEKCTRTWTYTSYKRTSSGTTINASTMNYSSTETFYACGTADIKAAEYPATSHTETPITDPQYGKVTLVVDGGASCSCN